MQGDALSAVFGALADPTRRQILEELKRGELGAGEIGAGSQSRHRQFRGI